MRRRALIGSSVGMGAALAAPARIARARGVIEIVTTADAPYAIADGPEPGFVLTLTAELFRMIALQVVFRFLPAAEAEARAAARTGVAIAPLSRTEANDARYLWAVALFDDASGFAALGQRAPGSLTDARDLPRIGVVAGSAHETYLRESDFPNLVPLAGRAELVAALRRREVAAGFGALPRLRADLGRAAELGRPIFTATAWLALNPATSDIPLAELRDAYAALEADGSLEQMLRPYLGPVA